MILETEAAVAFLDSAPASPYHALVIPKRHVSDLFEASVEDVAAVAAATKAVVDLYRDKLGLEAAEVSSHSGSAAQQAVFHLHVHVVPRFTGDGQDTHWKTSEATLEERRALASTLR